MECFQSGVEHRGESVWQSGDRAPISSLRTQETGYRLETPMSATQLDTDALTTALADLNAVGHGGWSLADGALCKIFGSVPHFP